jgi:hypothetical protein
VPQISCEWRGHANHEHENPNSIAFDAIAIKKANGEPSVRLPLGHLSRYGSVIADDGGAP